MILVLVTLESIRFCWSSSEDKLFVQVTFKKFLSRGLPALSLYRSVSIYLCVRYRFSLALSLSLHVFVSTKGEKTMFITCFRLPSSYLLLSSTHLLPLPLLLRVSVPLDSCCSSSKGEFRPPLLTLCSILEFWTVLEFSRFSSILKDNVLTSLPQMEAMF